MATHSDIEQGLEEALDRYTKTEPPVVPRNLINSLRYSLQSPQKRIKARLLLACAQMTGVDPRAGVSAAVALEMLQRSTFMRRSSEELEVLTGEALVSISFEVFSETFEWVKPEYFVQALRRLIAALGPRGVAGGEAEEIGLTHESSLDELRQMQAKKTGSLFSAAVLIPKDFSGIGDDSPEGLALDMFGRELGLAFQVLHDLEQKPAEASSASIRFFLQDQEARNMTVQRLKSASLSIESAWGEKAKPVLQIADEIRVKIENMVAD